MADINLFATLLFVKTSEKRRVFQKITLTKGYCLLYLRARNNKVAIEQPIMKRITFTMLLLTVLFAAKAQYFPIDTARLNSAYRAIISGERNIKTEMEFLESYPTLLPHKEEEYQRKFIDSNHKKIFNGYLDSQED